MKKEQQNNSTSNALTTTTQGILDNGQKELLAGGKVRSKAGGPEMVLVGFTTEKGYFLGDDLVSKLTYDQLERLAMKVIMSEDGEDYGYCKTFHTREFYKSTAFDEGLHIKNDKRDEAMEYLKKNDNDGIIDTRIKENIMMLGRIYKYKYNYSSELFYCLCKYWSNKDEEFKHILLLPSEIEFI